MTLRLLVTIPAGGPLRVGSLAAILTKVAGHLARKPFSDPVAEWGHLLAYLPQIKHRIERRQPRVLLLPPPQLSKSNEVSPRAALGQFANEQARAVQGVRREAEQLVTEYLGSTGRLNLLSLLSRGSG